MEIKTISEEFIRRMDAELKYNSKSYHKVGEPSTCGMVSGIRARWRVCLANQT